MLVITIVDGTFCGVNYVSKKYFDYIPELIMNKAQWNSVYFAGGIPRELVLELIDHSYDLVVQGLKKKDREALMSGKF
jgi:predicted DNA-binding protein (MmcQ/YjbR family)